MGNYPYAGDLFGQGLQPWPLRAACRSLRGSEPLKSLAAAVGSYYNATGAFQLAGRLYGAVCLYEEGSISRCYSPVEVKGLWPLS